MKTKLIALFLAGALTLTAGCGTQSAAEAPTPAPSSTPLAEATPTSSEESGMRTVTDMAGREVEIPTKIDKVYCAVPTAEALVCALAPEKLAAWVNEPSEDILKYLPARMADLPVVGGWMGQKVTANMEAIIAASPDVIVFNGTFSANSSGDETADKITQQTGIPVLVVYDPLDQTADTMRIMGDYLGVKERGEALAEYTENVMTEIKSMVEKIPEEDLVSVYYAEGEGGLSTDPPGSNHTEVIDFVRGVNVADVEMLGGMGMTSVSMEQILGWKPDIILVSATTAANYDEILSSSVWAQLQAVQDGKVYLTPSLPFNWFDRPPNITRVLGIQWFAHLLYPDYVDIDIGARIKDFYSLFFGVTLTDDDVTAITHID